jgi:predicted enzyme related to lactoylglutathione lyase
MLIETNTGTSIMTHTSFLRGLTTVNFFAADHEAAKQWYTDLLGMEPYFNRPGYVEFRIGDYQHELGIIDSKFMPDLEPSGKGPAGAMIYWHVDDLKAALEDLLARGATLHMAPREHGPGFVTASVIDPFGNVLGIMFNQHYLDIVSGTKA